MSSFEISGWNLRLTFLAFGSGVSGSLLQWSSDAFTESGREKMANANQNKMQSCTSMSYWLQNRVSNLLLVRPCHQHKLVMQSFEDLSSRHPMLSFHSYILFTETTFYNVKKESFSVSPRYLPQVVAFPHYGPELVIGVAGGLIRNCTKLL